MEMGPDVCAAASGLMYLETVGHLCSTGIERGEKERGKGEKKGKGKKRGGARRRERKVQNSKSMGSNGCRRVSWERAAGPAS